ncbi:MAG: hypothetical protein MZV70_69490 [Desulfobacterales bacterium]|nr:hypothetical protein [Desulfobacterales bacterium]
MTRDELLRREYLGRIERAVDFIYAHSGDDIGLDDIADAAAFSRFHFHRVFSGVVGERSRISSSGSGSSAPPPSWRTIPGCP